METRVHRVFTGLNEAIALETSGNNLYNQTTGAINLADRELGVYDAETLVSLNVTGANRLTTESGPVIFAMGYDSTGDGTVDTVIKSLPIDPSRLVKVSKQGYACPKAPIKRFTWTTTDCETEYCLKFNVNSVQISEYLGFNSLYKTFSVTTDCCEDGCDTCGGGDCDALATLLVDAINDDKDAFFTATAQDNNTLAFTSEDISVFDAPTLDFMVFTAGGNTFYALIPDLSGDNAAAATALQNAIQAVITANSLGGTATVTRNGAGDYTLAITSNYIDSIDFYDYSASPTVAAFSTTATAVTDGCPSIYVTPDFAAISDFCHLPVNLTEPNGISFEIYGDCAFDCNLTVTDVQSLQYEQGEGVGIKDMEEEAAAFGAELYRFTSLTQPDPTRTLLTNISDNYAVYVIEHDDLHEGAPSGHFFRSRWKTIIAVPTGTVNCNLDSVTESTLETALDVYLAT